MTSADVDEAVSKAMAEMPPPEPGLSRSEVEEIVQIAVADQLRAWGGDCASTSAASATCTLTMDADKTVSATFAGRGPLSLIVVSDGSTDSPLLEWTGGTQDATKWHYRLRTWKKGQPSAWTTWADIPTAATRSYRLTGLQAATAYDFEVRAVVGAVAGESSVSGSPSQRARRYPARGLTQTQDAAVVSAYEIIEGDGRTRWHIAYFTIVIPDGVRLMSGGAFVSAPCATPTPTPPGVEATHPPQGCPGGGSGTSLIDIVTGSELTLSLEGAEKGRFIVEPDSGSSEQRESVVERVNNLFDQIVASVTEVPQ